MKIVALLTTTILLAIGAAIGYVVAPAPTHCACETLQLQRDTAIIERDKATSMLEELQTAILNPPPTP